MTTKAVLAERLPIRRGLGEAEAATYISLSPSFFRSLVREGKMPKPKVVGSRRIWDIDELDAAFRDLPREGGDRDDDIVDTMADWQ